MKTPKIIRDTLQTPSGKWSRKSLTSFVSFLMSCLTGVFIVVSDYCIPESKTINQYAIMVFYGFSAVGTGTLGMTVYQKLKQKTSEQKESTP